MEASRFAGGSDNYPMAPADARERAQQAVMMADLGVTTRDNISSAVMGREAEFVPDRIRSAVENQRLSRQSGTEEFAIVAANRTKVNAWNSFKFDDDDPDPDAAKLDSLHDGQFHRYKKFQETHNVGHNGPSAHSCSSARPVPARSVQGAPTNRSGNQISGRAPPVNHGRGSAVLNVRANRHPIPQVSPSSLRTSTLGLPTAGVQGSPVARVFSQNTTGTAPVQGTNRTGPHVVEDHGRLEQQTARTNGQTRQPSGQAREPITTAAQLHSLTAATTSENISPGFSTLASRPPVQQGAQNGRGQVQTQNSVSLKGMSESTTSGFSALHSRPPLAQEVQNGRRPVATQNSAGSGETSESTTSRFSAPHSRATLAQGIHNGRGPLETQNSTGMRATVAAGTRLSNERVQTSPENRRRRRGRASGASNSNYGDAFIDLTEAAREASTAIFGTGPKTGGALHLYIDPRTMEDWKSDSSSSSGWTVTMSSRTESTTSTHEATMGDNKIKLATTPKLEPSSKAGPAGRIASTSQQQNISPAAATPEHEARATGTSLSFAKPTPSYETTSQHGERSALSGLGMQAQGKANTGFQDAIPAKYEQVVTATGHERQDASAYQNNDKKTSEQATTSSNHEFDLGDVRPSDATSEHGWDNRSSEAQPSAFDVMKSGIKGPEAASLQFQTLHSKDKTPTTDYNLDRVVVIPSKVEPTGQEYTHLLENLDVPAQAVAYIQRAMDLMRSHDPSSSATSEAVVGNPVSTCLAKALVEALEIEKRWSSQKGRSSEPPFSRTASAHAIDINVSSPGGHVTKVITNPSAAPQNTRLPPMAETPSVGSSQVSSPTVVRPKYDADYLKGFSHVAVPPHGHGGWNSINDRVGSNIARRTPSAGEPM